MPTKRSWTATATIATAIMVSPATLKAFVITMFPASTFNANTAVMDAALGIAGFDIEDFEDVNLLPTLTVQTTNPNSGPTGTLPKIYLDGSGSFFNNTWDGSHALVNTSTNDIWHGGPGENLLNLIAERVTFDLTDAARSFGVGLGNFQAELVDHALLVNGVEVAGALENFSDFTSGTNLRNGYLRIDAEPGESILSVAIETRANGTQTPVADDGLIFDHVAISQVPEPSTLGLLSILAILGLATCRRVV